MKFSQVNEVRIPKGSAKKIRHDGKVLWSPIAARYVALGDSIAVGHRINDNWEKDYGWDAQYGVGGRTETVIVPGCYTDLLHRDLIVRMGGNVNTTSFARSGDRVDDLIEKLGHDRVQNAIAKADYVTICIGANDVLEPALSHLEDYIWYGSIDELNRIIDNNLAVLADDSNPNSYTALFNKLSAINPDARYMFTTIYNPYKYLYIEEGRNGFFKPLLDLIPSMKIDIDEIIEDRFLGGTDLSYYDITKQEWVSIELEIDLRDVIISGVLTTHYFLQFFDRINQMSSRGENYVTRLNNVLKEKINAYRAVNPNFYVVDTKAVFDTYPDRMTPADVHYNDLVNVEFTRGYDASKLDWGAIWRPEYGSNAGQFYLDLAWRHLSFHNAFPSTNVWDYVSFNLEGFASDLINLAINRVFEANVDPHPEEQGHQVMRGCFAEAFGLSTLPRRTITFNANGGVGTMPVQTIIALDDHTAYVDINANAFSPGAEGYYFTGWNTAADGSGIAYGNGQLVGLTGDLTLYAQWSNIYKITVRHSEDSTYHGSGDTGPMECYALWIDGQEQPDLGAFSNGARVYNLPYGTPVGVIVETKSGAGRSYITWNGNKVKGNSSRETYDFQVKSNMDIHFEWNYWLDAATPPQQSYWNCYVTTY